MRYVITTKFIVDEEGPDEAVLELEGQLYDMIQNYNATTINSFSIIENVECLSEHDE